MIAREDAPVLLRARKSKTMPGGVTVDMKPTDGDGLDRATLNHANHSFCSDPRSAPIFEIFRGNYAMELLTAGVAHFGVFDRLAAGPVAPAS